MIASKHTMTKSKGYKFKNLQVTKVHDVHVCI